MSAPYPWLAPLWQEFATQALSGTLGHAYLISGRKGLGKVAFARSFAALQLCETPNVQSACGQCRGCLLVAAGNHPDIKILAPEEERSIIVVDQVRALIDYFALKPHYHTQKIGIIYPAEAMNGNAQNALLKVLEEPPAGALLMLVSHRPGQLLKTVQSRCQKIIPGEPSWQDTLNWVASQQESGEAAPNFADISLAGAPLDVLEQVQGEEGPPYDHLIATLVGLATRRMAVLVAARAMDSSNIRGLLDALELVIQAIIIGQAGTPPKHLHLSRQSAEHLHKISNKLNSKRLFFFLDQIASARSVVLRSSGVRSAEVVENLFYTWARLTQAEIKA